MAKAAFLLLVAASLLSVGASAPHGRLAWGGGQVHRRLSESITDACLDVCPGLSDFLAAVDSSAEPYITPSNWSNWYQPYKTMIDIYCDYESAVQCFVDELSTCSNSSAAWGIILMAPKLKCICGTCPGGETAWAKFLALASGFRPNDPGMVDTTTLADGTDTAGADDGNFDRDSSCAVYTVFFCANEYATDCGATLDGLNEDAGAILQEWNVKFFELESECTVDVVGSCGPFGLGWIAASLAPVMAALEFVAA
ncbi:unnamed protein product [Prorocentrum cordatum]|uniref:Uncharacterized protein n=1 Tax=Prorocentrum cordatum TaxID=2364126 RepID=A0ABN9Q0G0_9DINO|nr:unnamed protein product [Polarella glacialis]